MIDFFTFRAASLWLLPALAVNFALNAHAAGINSLQTEAIKQGAGVQPAGKNEVQKELKPEPAAEDEETEKPSEVDGMEVKAKPESPTKVEAKIEGPSIGGFSAGLGLASVFIPDLSTNALVAMELTGRRMIRPVKGAGSLWGSFRYAAHEFDAMQNGVSYRGVVEVFALGAFIHHDLDAALALVGGLDIGAAKIGIRDLTRFDRDPGLTRPGAVATLHGGLEWANTHRTSLGAKLIAGAGRVRTAGAIISSSFLY